MAVPKENLVYIAAEFDRVSSVTAAIIANKGESFFISSLSAGVAALGKYVETLAVLDWIAFVGAFNAITAD